MHTRIQFDSGQKVFFPGTIVTGTVFLDLKDATSARYVKLYVIGAVETHWSVTHTHTHTDSNGRSHTSTTTTHYRGMVRVINGESVLWGTGNKEKLPSGEHQFKFQFQVPVKCFPTFEGTHGHIRYACKVVVDRPWKFDHTYEHPFSVSPIYDLNLTPSLARPHTSTHCDKVGMPLFRKGHLTVTVTIPKGGYVPGEKLLASVFIENDTSKDVENLKIELKQFGDYAAFNCGGDFPPEAGFVNTNLSNMRHAEKEVACNKMDVKCLKHTKTTVDVPLTIPAVTPTFECAIIRTCYVLEVKVRTKSTFNSTVASRIPIAIGSVALGSPMIVQQPTAPPLNAGGKPNVPYPTAPYPNGGMEEKPRSSSSVYPSITPVPRSEQRPSSRSINEPTAPPMEAAYGPPPTYDQTVGPRPIGIVPPRYSEVNDAPDIANLKL